MPICKKYSEAICNLVKQQEEGTSSLTSQEFSKNLYLYSEGELEPCKSCKKKDNCHKNI